MSKRHIPESHSAHPNVTPLIDIIMCLIIFFMLVAKIGVTTGAEKIDIPSTAIGSRISDMSNTLTLNIPGKSFNIGDLPTVKALITPPDGTGPAMTTLALQSTVTGRNQLEDTLNMYKKQNPDFKVIIRADAKQDWRFIEPVLLTCNKAGVRTIEYNTAKSNGEEKSGS
jgi:biopolymer transport protein ExbD